MAGTLGPLLSFEESGAYIDGTTEDRGRSIIHREAECSHF